MGQKWDSEGHPPEFTTRPWTHCKRFKFGLETPILSKLGASSSEHQPGARFWWSFEAI